MIKQFRKKGGPLRIFEKGFTLFELVIAVVLIGVMAALALPRLNALLEKSRAEEGKKVLMAVLDAQRDYFLNHNEYAAGINQLSIEGLNSLKHFNSPGVYAHNEGGESPAQYTPGNSDNTGGISDRAYCQRDENGTDTYVLVIKDDGQIRCWPGDSDQFLEICQKVMN